MLPADSVAKFRLFLATFFEEVHEYMECSLIARLLSTSKQISNTVLALTSDGVGKPRQTVLYYHKHVCISGMIQWLTLYRFQIRCIWFEFENDIVDYLMLPLKTQLSIPGERNLRYGGPLCEKAIVGIDGTGASDYPGFDLHSKHLIDRNITTAIPLIGSLDVKHSLRVAIVGCSMNFGEMEQLEVAICRGSAAGSINKDAFRGRRSLRHCVLPEHGLHTILARQFAGCRSLSSIYIPDSVQSIGGLAFADCRALQRVALSVGLRQLGEETFMDCTSLTTITLPDNLHYIPYRAFEGCICLENIHLGRIKSIDDRAFFGCNSLKRIDIPNTTSSIGNQAFSECCALVTVTIGSGLCELGFNVFSECTSLRTVDINPNPDVEAESTGPDLHSVISVLLSKTAGPFRGCGVLERVMLWGRFYEIGHDGVLTTEQQTSSISEEEWKSPPIIVVPSSTATTT
jgi:hypothetical protein